MSRPSLCFVLKSLNSKNDTLALLFALLALLSLAAFLALVCFDLESAEELQFARLRLCDFARPEVPQFVHSFQSPLLRGLHVSDELADLPVAIAHGNFFSEHGLLFPHARSEEFRAVMLIASQKDFDGAECAVFEVIAAEIEGDDAAILGECRQQMLFNCGIVQIIETEI